MTLPLNRHMPDFLVIGAGKSGTTSLDNYLKLHPDVFISPVKEPNFFALEGQNISNQNEDRQQMFHYPWSVTSLEKYQALFENALPNQLKGETSPMYLYNDQAADRIKFYIPNVKLIAILRQPADRIYSRYMHLAQENRLPSQALEDIFDKDGVWWKRNDLVKEGFYHKHLTRYFELFPKENILVLLYDELVTDRSEVMTTIFEFLNIKSDLKIDTSPEFNPSGFIKNKFIDRLIGKQSALISTLSKLSPGLYNMIRNNPMIIQQINKFRKQNLTKPKFDNKLRKRITNDIYRDDIEKLQKLLNRDLSQWL